MKTIDEHLTQQLLASSMTMAAHSLAAHVLGDARTYRDCGQAARLLRLMYDMLTDDTPMTPWDVMETKVAKLVANDPAKVSQIMAMLKEVSGE